jgi:hypothetical protein
MTLLLGFSGLILSHEILPRHDPLDRIQGIVPLALIASSLRVCKNLEPMLSGIIGPSQVPKVS